MKKAIDLKKLDKLYYRGKSDTHFTRSELQSKEHKQLQDMVLDLQNEIEDLQNAAKQKWEEYSGGEKKSPYRILFESIDDGFCVVQLLYDDKGKAYDYRFLDVNPSFERQTGYENARGKRMLEIAPDFDEFWFETFGKIAESGVPCRFQRYASGANRWFDVYAFSAGDRNENQIGIIIRDISEEKHAQQELQDSEERFRALVTTGVNAIYRVSADWKQMNEVHGQNFVSETQNPDPEWMHEYILPEDQPEVWAEIEKAISDKSIYYFEHRVRKVDGSIGWISSRAVPLLDDEGEIKEWVGVAIDITERKMALKALKESEERFRALVTASSYSVFRINSDWSEVQQITDGDFPSDKKQFEENWLEKYVLKEDQPMVLTKIEYAIKTKTVIEFEHRVPHDDATISWAMTKAVPILDEQGRIYEWFGASSDISERKLAEEISRHSQALEMAYKELESFSYSVSHDLRSPLTSILGFSQILVEENSSQLDEAGQDYLKRIKASATRMNDIINAMLMLSRASRQEMHIQDIDLHDLAWVVIKELRMHNPEREVKVIIPKGLNVKGDIRMLNIMLTNLLGNAWKFTSGTSDAVIEIGFSQHHGQRTFFIRDNGSGFEKQQSAKIFAPFKRAHSSKEFSGSGIGLAIVERIVKRHQGKIWAEGETGKGATFYFTLG